MILQRPTYIGLAGAEDVKATAGDLVTQCKEAGAKWGGPMLGVVGGAVIGAVAGYFVPQILDRLTGAAEPPEFDLETGP